MNQLQEEILKVLIDFDEICKQHDIPYALFGGTHLGAVRHEGYIPWDDDIDIVVTRDVFEKLDKILKDKSNLPEGYYYQYVEYKTKNAISTPKFRSTTLDIAEKLPKTQKRYIGPWVDIFIWDNVPDDVEEQRKLFKKLKRIDLIIFVLLYVQYDPNRSGFVNIMKGVVQKINELIHPLYFFVPYLLRKRDRIAQSYNNEETNFKAANCYAFFRDFDEYRTHVVPTEYLQTYKDYNFEGHQFPSYEKYDELLTNYYGDYMTIPDEEDRITHNFD